MAGGAASPIEGGEWPLFGWNDDVRPALAACLGAGRSAVLATLFRVEGSAPRPPGTQMLFDGARASGYFSGDCIEGDVASHAAHVLADGAPRVLHYGLGSPWIDIRLRCGGALHILAERIAPDCPAAEALLGHWQRREPCLWVSDGRTRTVIDAGDAPAAAWAGDPLRVSRRFDPARRLIVSGGDPGALAIAALGVQAGLETLLLRPGGPEGDAPIAGLRYLRGDPAALLAQIGVDRWTAYVGATHEDEHDLAACAHALRAGAAYVGMLGATSRAAGRRHALAGLGASAAECARLRLPAGLPGLGKAPWEVAVAIIGDVMAAMNPLPVRA